MPADEERQRQGPVPGAFEGIGRPLHQEARTDHRQYDTEAGPARCKGLGRSRILWELWLMPDVGCLEDGVDHYLALLKASL